MAKSTSRERETEPVMLRRRKQPERRRQDGRPTMYYAESHEDIVAVPGNQFGKERQQETYIFQTEDGRHIPVVLSGNNGDQLPIIRSGNNGDQVPIVLSRNNDNKVPIVVQREDGQQVAYVIAEDSGQQASYAIPSDNNPQVQYVMAPANGQQNVFVMSNGNKQHVPYVTSPDNNQQVPYIVTTDDGQQISYILSTKNGQQVPFVKSNDNNQEAHIATENGPKVTFVVAAKDSHETSHDSSREHTQPGVLTTPITSPSEGDSSPPLSSKEEIAIVYVDSEGKRIMDIPVKLSSAVEDMIRGSVESGLTQGSDEVTSKSVEKEEGHEDDGGVSILDVSTEDISISTRPRTRNRKRNRNKGVRNRNRNRKRDKTNSQEEESTPDSQTDDNADEAQSQQPPPQHITYNSPVHFPMPLSSPYFPYMGSSVPSSPPATTTEATTSQPALITTAVPDAHVIYHANNRMSGIMEPELSPAHLMYDFQGGQPYPPSVLNVNTPGPQIPSYFSSYSQAPSKLSTDFYRRFSETQTPSPVWQRPSVSSPQHSQGRISSLEISGQSGPYLTGHPLRGDSSYIGAANNPSWTNNYHQHSRHSLHSSTTEPYLNAFSSTRQSLLMPTIHQPENPTPFDAAQILLTQIKNLQQSQSYSPVNHPYTDHNNNRGGATNNAHGVSYASFPSSSTNTDPIVPFASYQSSSTNKDHVVPYASYPSSNANRDAVVPYALYPSGNTNRDPVEPYASYSSSRTNKDPVGSYAFHTSSSTKRAPVGSYTSLPVSSQQSVEYDDYKPPNRQASLEYYNIRPGPNGQVHMNINMPPTPNRDQSSVYGILDNPINRKTQISVNRHRPRKDDKNRMQVRMGSYEQVPHADSTELLGSQMINFKRMGFPGSINTSDQNKRQQHTSLEYGTGSQEKMQENSDELMLYSEERNSKFEEPKANSTRQKVGSGEHKSKFEDSKTDSGEMKIKSEETESKLDSKANSEEVKIYSEESESTLNSKVNSEEVKLYSKEIESKLDSEADSEELIVISEETKTNSEESHSTRERDKSSSEDNKRAEPEHFYPNNGMPMHPSFLSAISALQYTPVLLQPMSYFNPMMQGMNAFPLTRTEMASPIIQSQTARKRFESRLTEQDRSFGLQKELSILTSVLPEKEPQVATGSRDSEGQLDESFNASLLGGDQAISELQSMEDFLYEISVEISSEMQNRTRNAERKRTKKHNRRRNRDENDRDFSIEILTEALEGPRTDRVLKPDAFTKNGSDKQEWNTSGNVVETHEKNTVLTTLTPELGDSTSSENSHDISTTENLIFNPVSEELVQDNEDTNKPLSSWYMSY